MSRPHICNHFVPAHSEQNGQEANRFFVGRYSIHEEEEFYSGDSLNDLNSNEAEFVEKHPFLTEDNLCVLKRSMEVLIEARSFLKKSYISAWAYNRRKQANHKAFECQQATLELFTERLGRMTHQTDFQD